jgi:hypothetical protein
MFDLLPDLQILAVTDSISFCCLPHLPLRVCLMNALTPRPLLLLQVVGRSASADAATALDHASGVVVVGHEVVRRRVTIIAAREEGEERSSSSSQLMTMMMLKVTRDLNIAEKPKTQTNS